MQMLSCCCCICGCLPARLACLPVSPRTLPRLGSATVGIAACSARLHAPPHASMPAPGHPSAPQEIKEVQPAGGGRTWTRTCGQERVAARGSAGRAAVADVGRNAAAFRAVFDVTWTAGACMHAAGVHPSPGCIADLPAPCNPCLSATKPGINGMHPLNLSCTWHTPLARTWHASSDGIDSGGRCIERRVRGASHFELVPFRQGTLAVEDHHLLGRL